MMEDQRDSAYMENGEIKHRNPKNFHILIESQSGDVMLKLEMRKWVWLLGLWLLVLMSC